MKRRNVFKWLGVLALSPLVIIPKLMPKSPSVFLESTPELISHHGVDAEKELTKMLSEEMRKDIDEEILKRMKKIHSEANKIYSEQGSQKTNFLVISDENYERLQ